MKIDVKKLYEKMIDFHRFGSILLAVGVFFYLGVIIPNEAKTEWNQYGWLGGSVLFLGAAIFFFFRSKRIRKLLEETEDGQEYLMKK